MQSRKLVAANVASCGPADGYKRSREEKDQ